MFYLALCSFSQSNGWQAQHVIFIGLDGLSSRAVENGDMPTLHQLIKEGAHTLKKRSVLPSSSAVNWATIFMGAGPEMHGFTTWGSQTPEIEPLVITHYGLFPSIWGLLRDQYPDSHIAYFYQWDGFQYFAELKAMDFQKHVFVEKTSTIKSYEAVALEGIDYIKKQRPNLIGIFIDEPDGKGHAHGFDSPQYYKMVKKLDKYLKKIIEGVKESGIYDDTIFVITSDHGGIEKDHGGKTPEEMNTPLIICGKNIKKGFHIEIPIMQYDVAPTLAYIFNIQMPEVWIGKPLKMIFEEMDKTE